MKTILITGSSSGIGKSCKIVFLKNGFKVIGLDINEQNNEDNLLPFKTSILDENNLKSISEYLSNNNIKLDIILNVACFHKMASLVENEFNDLKKVIDVNLQGTMLINNIFYKHLKEKGRIIIVTSEVAGFDPMPFNGLYNVSKTALDCYAQALRQELNLLGQKVITIRPGAIKTPLCDKSLEDTKKYGSEGRDSDALYQLLLSSQDVEVAVFLRQDSISTCTGGFRSLDKVDVSQVAAKFGGGGHKNASGMCTDGKLENIIPQIVKEFSKIL